MIRRLFLAAAAAFAVTATAAQPNYDESKVPEYTLPDLLTMQSGKTVRSARAWTKQRRPEILAAFTDCMYGNMPPAPAGLHFRKVGEDESVYGGKAVRRRILVCLDKEEAHTFEVLLHIPSGGGPHPVFVGLNFKNDNQETIDLESQRRWPYELIVDKGFAVATATRNSIEPDDPGNPQGGVREWYSGLFPGQYSWGAISAWAWGISRIVDCLETVPGIDTGRIAVIGHSRLGKTALWAAANDPRIALVVSNNAGCCGDAISRREFGETFAIIRQNFPHWFCPHFSDFTERDFPTDQHGLVALSAPRPVYIGSAEEDLWADPKGEWLCAVNVRPVYSLFRLPGLSGAEMPAAGEADGSGTVAYKIRPGVHDIIPSDWETYLEFAKRKFE